VYEITPAYVAWQYGSGAEWDYESAPMKHQAREMLEDRALEEAQARDEMAMFHHTESARVQREIEAEEYLQRMEEEESKIRVRKTMERIVQEDLAAKQRQIDEDVRLEVRVYCLEIYA